MDKEAYLDFCRALPGAAVDQPFEGDFDSWIARHGDSRKWFAAVLRHDGRDFVDLKCDPLEGEFLRSVYAGVTEGYHMNKRHWISVFFESDVPDALLCALTKASFRLTQTARTRKKEGL